MMNGKNALHLVCSLALALSGLASFLIPSVVAQAGSNLVQNPSFETAGAGGAADAANWTEVANQVRANDKFRTGAWSLKSTVTPNGATTQGVSVVPNTAYTFSGYAWKTNTVGNACIDMSDIVGETQRCTTAAGSWVFLTGAWSSGTNSAITVRVYVDGNPTGAIWFDDISLADNSPTPTNTPAGPTNTPTNASIGPTNTPTRASTPTNTPIPPTATNTPASVGNVIQNSGFETQGTGGTGDAANWTEGLGQARAKDKFRTGAWSLKSTVTTNGATSQGVSVVPSTTYTYSGYAWKTNTVGNACIDMGDLVGEVQRCTNAAGSWVLLTGAWNSGTNSAITVRAYVDGNPTGAIWFDDISLLGPAGPTATPSPTNTPTKTNTPGPSPTPLPAGSLDILGNVIVGYQGWFDAAGSGSPINRWNHWANQVLPSPGNVHIELYPDVREYPASVLFQTGLANLGNGSPSKLFESYAPEVVNLHFKWMKDNNINGAALQRFGVELTDPAYKTWRDGTATNVKNAAEANGRSFYIMYDTTGMGTDFVSKIESDWTNTIVPLGLTSSPNYAMQNGKKVVCLWGMAFTANPGSASDWTTLIAWFKNQNIYVIGGVPWRWRTNGSGVKAGFDNVWQTLNMLQPWVVGSYKTDAEVDSYRDVTLIPDRDYLASHGVDFQPIVYPGFAWSNWNGGTQNMFPRRQGNLFWRQAYNIKLENMSTMYIAMFDEYDEGTAIAKAAEDSSMKPTNQYFLTLDADGVHLSSDFYLRLAGAANQMLKGQIPLSLTIPIPH